MPLLTPHPRRIALTLAPEGAARWLRARPGFVWLDSPEGAAGISLLAADPVRIIKTPLSETEPLREALASLAGTPTGDLGLPSAGLIGTIDFDGQCCFGVYPEVMAYVHATGQWWETGGLSRHLGGTALSGNAENFMAPPEIDFQPLWSKDGFIAATERALEYIAAGDIYQVNLAQPWQGAWPVGGDAFGYYEALRAFSPAPHAAFLDLGGRQIASASPELFLRLSGRTIQTRPIKGTRPRHRRAQDDERAAYDLLTSPKEIAELIMITDLERNDLGQVCEFGSVTVADLLKLERYQQVFHLLSTVEGSLREEVDHIAALQACFPGGSISGAPKKRALEIIRELEPFPRGLFTGAIGYLGANGESQFSIAIRTAIVENGHIHFHAGAGIVADSSPEREYEETWHKAATLLGAAGWRGQCG